MFGFLKSHKKNVISRLTLFLGICIFVGLYLADFFEARQQAENEQRLELELQITLSDLVRDIKQSIEIYSLELNSIRSFIYSSNISNLSYESFREYSINSDFENNYPGARGFGFIRLVEVKDEAAFIESAVKERGGDFQIHALSDKVASRFIIQYIEPERDNQQAIGLDVGSEENRRNAALSAAHHNAVTLTAPITLVQADAKIKHGFLLLLPVFDKEQIQGKNSVSNVLGWVYAPLLIDEILSSIHQHNPNYRITISDVTANDIEFFQMGDDEGQMKTNLQQSSQLNLFGREWHIRAFPNDQYAAQLGLVSPSNIYYQVLAISFLLTLLLCNIFYLMYRHLLSLRQKSELAAVVENGIEGMIGLDEKFCLKYWNNAADELFGFNEDSYNKPFLDWLICVYDADYLIDLFKRVAQGQSVKHFEITLNSSDTNSEPKYLSLNFQPIFQYNTFLGASVSMVDLSEVHALQHLLEEKNQLLSVELSQQDSKLKVSSSLHESLLQGADFLIITTDQQGFVTSTSRKLEEFLEYSQSEVLGESITKLFDSKYLSSLGSNVFLSFKYTSENPFDFMVYPLKHQARVVSEGLFIHKNGSSLELQLTISSITDADGKVFGYLFIADDIRVQKALKFNLGLVNAAIQSSEDILLWFDEKGVVCNSNPHARSKLEYTEYELKQTNVSDILSFESNASWQNQLANLKASSSFVSERSINTRSSQKIPCLVTISKLNINGVIYFFLSAKDISDRLAKEHVLENALDVAAQANQSKDQFLANMGHELRTPLNEVNGNLQLIELTDLSTVQLDYLSRAKQSVRSLTQSIDDVLDCGEIIRNKMTLKEERIDLLEVFNSVGHSSSIIAEDKKIEIYFDISDEVPQFVNSDAHRLYQLLMCLMSNAVKFTFEGDVVLHCGVVTETKDKYELKFQVSDSGVGISEEKQAEIFELFSQGEMGANRSFGGLGLGLTISKKIIELMFGHISCKSEVGVGTTFSFNVFVGKVADEPVTEALLSEVPSLKILVVDDNEISLSVLSRMISQLGWELSTATGADDAVQKLEQSIVDNDSFDLALIDWNMPEKSGLDLVKEIRKQFNPKDMPILVMVTAFTRKMLSQIDNRDVESLLSAFLTKPITRTMLLDLVRSVLGPGRQGFTSYRGSQLRLEDFRILLVEDNETNQFIAKNLLQSQGAIVTIASEGEEAFKILNEQSNRFDIVLMDIQMPGWDGYKATKEIRADERFKDLPILAMTANVLNADKRKCFDVGMNGHIGKPFELTQLVQEILSLARKPKLLHVHRVATEKARKFNEAVRVVTDVTELQNPILLDLKKESKVNIEKGIKRFAGSEELYVKSLNMFAKDLENYIDELTGDGNELTFEVVKPILHTLKGTSGLLGFSGLANLAMECEQLAQMIIPKGINEEPFVSLIQLMKKKKIIIDSIFKKHSDAELDANTQSKVIIDLAKLQELGKQLKNSNMHAIKLHAELQQDLSQFSSKKASDLNESISKFDFKTALKVLVQIEKEYLEFVDD